MGDQCFVELPLFNMTIIALVDIDRIKDTKYDWGLADQPNFYVLNSSVALDGYVEYVRSLFFNNSQVFSMGLISGLEWRFGTENNKTLLWFTPFWIVSCPLIASMYIILW